MYFDALTLTAVADELRSTILGGRIQRVRLPSQQSVALEIYAQGRRYHLLLSAHQQWTRVHLTAAKPSRGVERDTPLLLLLRKYVVGGRIRAIEQPATERVLLFSIAKGAMARNTALSADNDALDEEPFEDDALDDDNTLLCELIIEAMERRANIILVGDDNIILESVRHIPPSMSRRPILPHEAYELPPAQDKRDPHYATAEGIRSMLEEHEGQPLWRAIVNTYRGFSPLAAREIAFRATGEANIALSKGLPWDDIASAVRAMWEAPWQPSVVEVDGEITTFAPYLLTHLGASAAGTSISAVLDRFYTAREQLSGHEQRRSTIRAQLLDTRERLDRQRRLLSEELERAQNLEQLRWEGEMIYGFLHSIKRGQTSLEVEGRTITLNPARTPIENAQDRFHAYDKAKGALAGVPERLAATQASLAGLDETLALLELAEGFEAIEAIAREATDQGYLKAPTDARKLRKGRRLAPLRLTSREGYAIYVGRSAGQNEQVTFKIAAPNDIWLHARGIPGAHVVIKNGGREVSEQTIREAAELAAYYSSGRTEAAVDVELTRRSQVRRVADGPPGLATYRAERSIRVTPRLPSLANNNAASKDAALGEQ